MLQCTSNSWKLRSQHGNHAKINRKRTSALFILGLIHAKD
ncbi:hypothetical protein V6Z12_A12G079600 [Gossypium hirsutum]